MVETRSMRERRLFFELLYPQNCAQIIYPEIKVESFFYKIWKYFF